MSTLILQRNVNFVAVIPEMVYLLKSTASELINPGNCRECLLLHVLFSAKENLKGELLEGRTKGVRQGTRFVK